MASLAIPISMFLLKKMDDYVTMKKSVFLKSGENACAGWGERFSFLIK
jgi:hypothetical protein